MSGLDAVLLTTVEGHVHHAFQGVLAEAWERAGSRAPHLGASQSALPRPRWRAPAALAAFTGGPAVEFVVVRALQLVEGGRGFCDLYEAFQSRIPDRSGYGRDQLGAWVGWIGL